MVNSKISIRQTKKLDEVLILNALIFPEDELDVGVRTNHWIARDNNSGKQIGFCSVSDFGHGILFLSRSGLLREYRGRGIQRRFIRTRERYAITHGFSKIITYTHRDNYSSMASLIRNKYKVYDPEYDYAGKDFIYFIKEL